MNTETIKDFYGRILGTVDTDSVGNKTARDFYGKVLGKYNKKSNTTTDFYGRILAKGDITNSLVMMSKKNV